MHPEQGMNSADSRQAMQWAASIPVVGVVASSGLYFWAAAVYPSAIPGPGEALGYSHLFNYWCDLLVTTAPSGEPNPARPLALIATSLLPLSLIPLWLGVPALFRHAAPWGRLVQGCGALAMLSAALVWTSHHDLALHGAAGFGVVALIVTLLAIDARRYRPSILAAVAAGLLAVANYALWSSGSLPAATPVVQKAALVAVFAWVVVTASAIRRGAAVERRSVSRRFRVDA